MKMTKRLTGVQRRAIILEEASRLFAFKGLQGATTREIAKAAGISEPILYQHFKSKEEIYDSLELLCLEQVDALKNVVKRLDTGTDSLIMLTYLLIRAISFCKEPGQKAKPKESGPSEILLRLMGYSFLEEGRFARVLVDNCIGAIFDHWHACYRKALVAGDLNVTKADPTQLWIAYESMIGMGLFVLPGRQLIDKVKDSESGAKSATTFLLRAIGVKESVILKIKWSDLRKAYFKSVDVAAQSA